jgi:hypothetical protein
MAKMQVVAVKLSKEPISIKVAYQKEGKLYIRTGEDGFTHGKPANAPLNSLLNKWGFRRVGNPPEFRDAEELIDGITGFGLQQDGTIKYQP